MEHRLPKEIKGLLPPNTMDTDFKAELYGALLAEAGFDTAQIMMVRDGNNLSNVSKDIRSVKYRNHVGIAEGTYIELKTNRRGIYDSLPEGLFHEALFPGKVKDLGLILEEMQQHSNEEFFIRRFFSLLESEVDREGIQAQLLELRYDKKNKYSDYAKLFAACWPVIHILSGQGALLFIKFMPHIHSIRGRLEEVSDALSQILEAPVKVRPKMVQRTIRAQKPNRLGNMRLGANSVNVGVLNSAEADLHIHISDLPTREVERFLPGNRSRKALEMLADIFLGAWQEFDVTVSVSPDERKTYLKPTGDASPCYLGIKHLFIRIMKAKNSEKIIRGYLEFAGGLLISTALSMALLTGFIHTNESEYKLMESKTQEYDKIYARQIALVDKVDSLYNYLVLMGSNDRLNQVVLQKVISTRKMELIEELQIMDSKDVLLYKKLASQINVFLDTKEAIRKAVIEESLVRKDLMRCIQDNKQATRKLTLGNISVEK